ncbi:MAG TPA: DUF1874 domain-containing protein [Dissulfurispiraceae bacterium]|nr:DUF1874 domain-containing protein [Dissulfurispiraceae bacterium]
MIYVLNAPVITNYGHYRFDRITPGEAKQILSNGFTSAVGHESTARLMSEIIGVDIVFNRITIRMEPGDKAVCLWLLDRPGEAQVYSKDDLASKNCELGLLERTD